MSKKMSKKVVVFINDDMEYLLSIAQAFPGVIISECHSVDEALDAIELYDANVIFLDNELSEGKNEGLEVARLLARSGKTVYANTTREDLALLYKEMGADYVSPMNFTRMREIIQALG